ncbi:MAG: 4-phosphoerythronate dehydrogenase [Succinivibrionaceae bacterium]|nr:4-phosphoerythronate dehydrogenase [Succinivibrionaceae bacterium]
MRIVADEALPNAVEVLSQYGEVILRPGRGIGQGDLVGADALVIRSVTRVGRDLLEGADRLRFVGTATAGFDHVDTALLRERGIAFSAAPGNNAASVGDYVLSALLVMAQRHGLDLGAMSIGIVGCGHVGSEVLAKARALGMRTVVCDPPLHEAGREGCGASLAEALACDITTLHVPLERAPGPLCTFHMVGRRELEALPRGHILINASRGPVVDNEALLGALRSRPDLRAWLDVFEGEPQLSCPGLIPLLEGATAHIAGYSFESKRRATVMVAAAMARALSLEPPRPYAMPGPEVCSIALRPGATPDLDLITRLCHAVYDVRRDDAAFRRHGGSAAGFDRLRRDYRERRELSSVRILGAESGEAALWRGLGFSVGE